MPVLGICGYSGSGKTTLIEAVLPRLLGQGLKVAVVKLDAHRMVVDKPGKDSDRFFQTGADVFLGSSENGFYRFHGDAQQADFYGLYDLALRYDLILVEGYRHSPLPKVWLLAEGWDAPPDEVNNVLAVLPWDSDRSNQLLDFIAQWHPKQWQKSPRCGCILLGANDEQMAIEQNELASCFNGGIITIREQGGGDILPIVNASWPLSGILAARRWQPEATWVFIDGSKESAPQQVEKLIAADTPGTRGLVLAAKQEMPGLLLVNPRLGPQLESLYRSGGELASLVAEMRSV